MSQWQLSANARALLKVLRGEWTLAVSRFPDLLGRRLSRDVALREIARCFLSGAGTTARGELSRVTGLSRPDAGRGNRSLVAEGYATMISPGRYTLRTPFTTGPAYKSQSVDALKHIW